MMKSCGAPGTPYSYAPWYTTGWTPPKLSNGGGEGTDHSSVVAFQGFAGAFGPFQMLQNRLITKISCTAAVKKAAAAAKKATKKAEDGNA